MTNMRIERDCLGEMEIPNDRYYGIQTIRNMKVSGAAGFPVVAYPDMHKALCQIKKACAKANAEIGAMKPEIAQAISEACGKESPAAGSEIFVKEELAGLSACHRPPML